MHRFGAIVVIVAALFCAPASGAAAATSATFDDPIGDSLEFAPDLGVTAVTVGDDETVTVDTRFVARPPAGWGGCAYYVAGICIPADMTLTWYIDHTANSGSLADGGADAKVVAIPRRETTTWEGSRWDAANGKFAAGAPPVASDDASGARWTLRLADLGIPRPSTVRIWAVSLYKSYNGLGVLFDYEDTAGPGTVSVEGPPASGPTAAGGACKRKAKTVNAIQRRIRALRRQAANGDRRAGRKLRRLRETRGRAVRAMKRRCGPPVEQAEPPSAAPPGCKLVTKPVLQQEGVGIHAEWVVKPEVVVECSK